MPLRKKKTEELSVKGRFSFVPTMQVNLTKSRQVTPNITTQNQIASKFEKMKNQTQENQKKRGKIKIQDIL